MKTCKTCTTEVVKTTYCDVCINKRRHESNKESQRKVRLKAQKPCRACKVVMTGKEYCNSCAQTIRRSQLKKHKIKPCKMCEKDFNYHTESSKYCESCIELRMDMPPVKKYKNKEEQSKGFKMKSVDPKYLSRNCKTYAGYTSL